MLKRGILYLPYTALPSMLINMLVSIRYAYEVRKSNKTNVNELSYIQSRKATFTPHLAANISMTKQMLSSTDGTLVLFGLGEFYHEIIAEYLLYSFYP